MNHIKKIDISVWVFLGLPIIILWQMLLPGYVLTLDMVFTPKMEVLLDSANFYNTLPVWYFLKIATLVAPSWLVQKFILLALFFSIGYLAFRFLPVGKGSIARYFGAFFYLFNPFVYTRFLAGHWMFLFAYAFLPPFIYYLLKFSKDRKLGSALRMSIWLLLIGAFSLHVFAAAGLVVLALVSHRMMAGIFSRNHSDVLRLIKTFVPAVLLFILVSGYWIAPAILDKEVSILSQFDRLHWEAFSTSSDSQLGAYLNVFSMYGYWGERMPWASGFLWPKANLLLWMSSIAILSLLLAAGIMRGLRDGKTRRATVFFLVLGGFAFIFSCGLGDTIFKGINLWLFEHVFFWRGFRDSNKWSAFLVLAYAYLSSLGVRGMIEMYEKGKFFKKSREVLFVLLFLVPILGAYTMLPGFSGQLRPVWYPKSWQEAKNILDSDQEEYRVLFLPWHEYFSLGFDDNLVVSNPARRFFGEKIVSSYDMEMLSDDNRQQFQPREAAEVQRLMENSDELTRDQIIDQLKRKNFKYVIFSRDLAGKDSYEYHFLESPRLKVDLDRGDLTVFEIPL